MIRWFNLGVALLLELAVIFAVGYWGFAQSWMLPMRLLAGLGAPLMVAALWGVFASPRAYVPLHGVADAGFRIAWFGTGALAFWVAGLPVLALALAAVYTVNALMLRQARTRIPSLRRDDHRLGP